jgi:hypothetical protein
MEIKETRIPNFGEQLVGLDFNPSGDPTVRRVKEICAELAEILKKNYAEERSPIKSLLFDHAIGEVLNAQMCVVKVITYKEIVDETV